MLAMSAEHTPKVNKSEGGGFRISDIRSDTNPQNSLSIAVTDGGDVGISIVDPEKGMVDIALVTRLGGGRNPEITKKFRDLARELAELIESGEVR